MEQDRKLKTEDILLDAMPKEAMQTLQEQINKVLREKHNIQSVQGQFVGEGVPVEIFSLECSPAEAIVKYLKEEKEMNFHEIGDALSRDERGIWGSYNRAKKKMGGGFEIKESKYKLPLEIFNNRNKSILEIVITYLHEEKGIKFSKIAKILGKKYSTVYTTYTRSKKKKQN